MAKIDDWAAIAEQKKNKAKQDYINNNASVLNNINAQRDMQLKSLENSNLQQINNLNDNRNSINEQALENAKMANVNRVLALKDNQNAMSRAGLNTQGLVGSQVNSINSAYGNSLNNIIKDKTTGLRGIDTQINNANLQYETNKANINAQYAKAWSDKQAEIENVALQLGNQAYNNYISQQQAAEELAMKQREADRQNQLAWASLNARNSISGGSPVNNYSSFTDNSSRNEVETAYYSGRLNKDARYGVFSNGYQPDNINGTKLKKTGDTIVFTTYDRNGTPHKVEQNIWKANGKYYMWDGRINRYKLVNK